MDNYNPYMIGGLQNYAADSCFWNAFNSYNPHFRAASSDSTSAQLAALKAMYEQNDSTPTALSYDTTGVSLPTATAEAEESGVNTGMVVGGALATAAAIGACVIGRRAGNGKGIIQGWKNIVKGFKSGAKNVENVTSRFTAQRVNGKNLYMIPGENITVKNNIEAFAQKNGVNLRPERLKFNSEFSKINAAEFESEVNGLKYTVKIKDGKFEIFDTNGNALSEAWAKNKDMTEALAGITDRVNTIQSGVIKGNYSAFKGLKNVEYTNTLGDDVITIQRDIANRATFESPTGKWHSQAADRKVTELTTLERFDENSDKVQAYFNNNSGTQDKFTSKSITKGKLPEDLNAGGGVIRIGNNYYHFANGEVSGVEIGNRYFARGTTQADAAINREKKKVDQYIKQIYQDKTLLPDGFTFS